MYALIVLALNLIALQHACIEPAYTDHARSCTRDFCSIEERGDNFFYFYFIEHSSLAGLKKNLPEYIREVLFMILWCFMSMPSNMIASNLAIDP